MLESQGLGQQALALLAGGLDQPDQPAALYQRLGLALAKHGRLEDAAKALEIAARLNADAKQAA